MGKEASGNPRRTSPDTASPLYDRARAGGKDEAASLRELYPDPIDAAIAHAAQSLTGLTHRCVSAGRPVPATVLDAIDALWRWAGHELTPRGRKLRPGRLSGPYQDTPLPFDRKGKP